VLTQLGAAIIVREKHETKCSLRCASATVLFNTLIANICSLIENLSPCSSAEAGIVLNLFLKFEQKMSLVFL